MVGCEQYCVVVIVLAVAYVSYWQGRLGPAEEPSPEIGGTQLAGGDGLFLSDGVPIVLPSELEGTNVQYFGNEAVGDFDKDGRDDRAFIITQQTDGSGTFFYVLVMRATDDGYAPTKAFFLGDRIAPQSTSVRDGLLDVSYATRLPDEPMTAEPTVGKSLTLYVADGSLHQAAVLE